MSRKAALLARTLLSLLLFSGRRLLLLCKHIPSPLRTQPPRPFPSHDARITGRVDRLAHFADELSEICNLAVVVVGNVIEAVGEKGIVPRRVLQGRGRTPSVRWLRQHPDEQIRQALLPHTFRSGRVRDKMVVCSEAPAGAANRPLGCQGEDSSSGEALAVKAGGWQKPAALLLSPLTLARRRRGDPEVGDPAAGEPVTGDCAPAESTRWRA